MITATEDINQIEQRGSSLRIINQQLAYFESDFPAVTAVKPASVGDGIIQLSDSKIEDLAHFFDTQADKKYLLKFVPASGAATRMFKSLYSALNDGKVDKEVEFFFDNLTHFSFYEKLKSLIPNEEINSILIGLLTDAGLGYGQLPKGLLDFHKYENEIRTAIEEHLIEGVLYAKNKTRVRLHFTVSPEHKKKFNELIKAKKKSYEDRYSVKFFISFSEQKPSTDTLAVDKDNQPKRNFDGQLLFRPAGHGALLENLNELNADIIFIKNIDNVVPDKLKAESIRYKKALAGLLLEKQKRLHALASRLDKPTVSASMINKAAKFLQEEINIIFPKGFRQWTFEDKLAFVQQKINRPLRVCGMVKNVGEPGGGPFWVKAEDGTVSLQIVESAQFNFKSKKQVDIFQSATHFNPVDLICGIKNYKKESFDLLKFRDDKAGFICIKSFGSQTLKAQELPGLWNGGMSDWNTLFVEVPLITFNPVKTINDLLRPEHQ